MPNSTCLLSITLTLVSKHPIEASFFILAWTTYLDVRSTCGLYQCLLRLQTLPVSVVHGQGATVRDSHVEAARNALQYLSIVASEKTTQTGPTQWLALIWPFFRGTLHDFIIVLGVVTFFMWDETSVTTSTTPVELVFRTSERLLYFGKVDWLIAFSISSYSFFELNLFPLP